MVSAFHGNYWQQFNFSITLLLPLHHPVSICLTRILHLATYLSPPPYYTPFLTFHFTLLFLCLLPYTQLLTLSLFPNLPSPILLLYPLHISCSPLHSISSILNILLSLTSLTSLSLSLLLPCPPLVPYSPALHLSHTFPLLSIYHLTPLTYFLHSHSLSCSLQQVTLCSRRRKWCLSCCKSSRRPVINLTRCN